MDKALFTVLGWEDRFILGAMNILGKYDLTKVYLICFTDYLYMNNMTSNLELIEKELKLRSIQYQILELNYGDSVQNWKYLDNFFSTVQLSKVLLNITTFPRETVWTFLFFLKNQSAKVDFIYYKPMSYDKNESGLTKNHKNPRLLFKHSGIFDISKKLVIFIITGFDNSRTDLLIEHFEPAKVIYLSQIGDQFENQKRNCGISPKTAFENILMENIAIDSYNILDTFEILSHLVEENFDYNVIITSQGPKTSAISTYMTYLKYSNIALAYVPAREFSGQYSYGIDNEPVVGQINF